MPCSFMVGYFLFLILDGTKKQLKTHTAPKRYISLHGTPVTPHPSFLLPSAPLNSPLGMFYNSQLKFCEDCVAWKLP